jgi:ABC-2 type transport system ATP-binding protein
MIRVDQVSKRYGRHLAVDDVSFTIGDGEIVGFLGPNGAGKSTLLKLMSTWLRPTSGSIAIDGHDTQAEPLAVRRSLGYLTEHNALYEGMRVDRFLRFMGRSRGLSGARLAARTDWVVQACTLGAVLGKRVHECSKGFRQRIGVAAALIHDPRVILLDEPTHGLDPLQVVAFREFVQGLRSGRAVLFSSHILSEVLSISERVLVIHHGRLLADRRVEALHEEARRRGADVEAVVLDIVRTHDAEAGRAALGGAA